MARKGKTPKVPKIDPALAEVLAGSNTGEAVGWAKRVLDGEKTADGLAAIREWEAENGALTPEELAAATTKLCTEHVPNEEKPFECAKCGKPMPNVETFPLSVLDELTDDARQSEKRAEDDGPAYEKHSVRFYLDSLWSMRLSVLAKEAGLSERDYVEKLIRRQWVARGKTGQ